MLRPVAIGTRTDRALVCAFATMDLWPEGSIIAATVQDVPRTIGFRFRYSRGSIENGIGGPLDFEWTAIAN